MKDAGGRLGLTLVCFLFGVLIVVQLRTESRLQQATATQSSTDFAAIAGDLYDSNSLLRQEVDKLTAERSTVQQSTESGNGADVIVELQRLKAYNGVGPVTGPGVVLTVDAELRPVDLLDLLNELRNAGAEAIAIGDQRVVFNSAITGSAGQLFLNAQPVVAPIVVHAVGTPEVLNRALARKGGMLSYLKTSYPKASIDLADRDSLTLPAFQGGFVSSGS